MSENEVCRVTWGGGKAPIYLNGKELQAHSISLMKSGDIIIRYFDGAITLSKSLSETVSWLANKGKST